MSVRRRGYTAAPSECGKVHACNFSNLITSLLVGCHERALKLLGSFSFSFFMTLSRRLFKVQLPTLITCLVSFFFVVEFFAQCLLTVK